MNDFSPTALAARLVAHAGGLEGSGGVVGPQVRAVQRMAIELCQWIGPGGCHRLLSRAFHRAAAEHPALAGITIGSGSPPSLDRVEEAVAAHGAADTAAGLESALAVLLEQLSRLIGEDLSIAFAESSMSDGVPDAATPAPEKPPTHEE